MLYGAGKYRYELVDGWAKLPRGWSFDDIGGLTVDSQDRVYVLTRSPHPVMVFDHDGNLLATWGEGLFGRAHGVCIGTDGSIYCTDDKLHVVYKFTPEGELLQTLGNQGQPSGTGYVLGCWDLFWGVSTIERGAPPFNRPTGVTVSASGEIYVSDGYGNARVHKFAPDGNLLFSWGEPGYAPGHFRLPHSIWLDREERIWVVDRENNRIQLFNSQGEFLSQWGDLIRPTDIWIDEMGTVYVSELCLRFSIFDKDGKLQARWGNEAGTDKERALFLAPHALAVDSRGDIYIGDVCVTHDKVDRGPRNLRKFARKNK